MRTKCDFQFVLSLRKISEIIIMIVMIITIMHWQCTVQFSHHFMLITLFVSHNSTGILYRADHQPVIKKNKKNPFLSPPPQGWQKIEEKKELSLKKKDDFFPCFYHGFLYPNNCLLGGILKSFLFFSLLPAKTLTLFSLKIVGLRIEQPKSFPCHVDNFSFSRFHVKILLLKIIFLFLCLCNFKNKCGEGLGDRSAFSLTALFLICLLIPRVGKEFSASSCILFP